MFAVNKKERKKFFTNLKIANVTGKKKPTTNTSGQSTYQMGPKFGRVGCKPKVFLEQSKIKTKHIEGNAKCRHQKIDL